MHYINVYIIVLVTGSTVLKFTVSWSGLSADDEFMTVTSERSCHCRVTQRSCHCRVTQRSCHCRVTQVMSPAVCTGSDIIHTAGEILATCFVARVCHVADVLAVKCWVWLVLSLTVSCCWRSCCEVLSLTGALTYCVMLLTFLLWSVEFDWCSHLLCHAADVLAVKCWVWLVLSLTVSCCWRSCCEVLSLTGALTYCVMLLTFLLWSVEFDWCSHLLCHAVDVLAVKCWVWLVLSLTVSCCWRSCCEVLSLTGALTYCVMLLTFLLWSVEFDWCSHLLCHAVDVLAVKCWVWLVLSLTVSCCWRSCCEVLSLTGALTYCVMLLTFLLWSVESDWCSHLLCHAADVLAVKCWVWLVLSLTVSCCWRSCCEVLSLTGALTYCVMLLTFLLWSVEFDWCSHLLCHAVDFLAVKCWVWLVLSLTVSCCWLSCCEVLSLTGALTYCVMLLTFLLWSVEFDWCSHLLCHAADVLAVKCWVWLVLSLTVSCCWRSCCEVLSLTGALTYCVMLLTFLLWSVESDWCSHLLCHAVDVLAVKCWVWLVLSLTVSCCWRSCCEVLSLTGALTYCVMLLTFLLWSVEFDWCSHLLCHAVDVLAVKCWVWLVLSLTVSCCWRSCCEVLSLTGALTYCVMLLTFLLWSVESDWCSHLLCHAVDVLAVKCWVWLVLSLTVSCCWRSCCEVLSLTGALTYCVMLLTFLLWSVESDWCSHLLCHAVDVLAVKCWVWLVLSLTVSCCWRSCCEVLSLTGALTYCVMLLTFLLWSVEFDWCSHLLCHAVDVLAVKCWVWLVLSLTVSCCWRSCCEVLSLTGALTYCVMLLTFLLWSVEFDWCSHLLCHAVDVLAVKCWVWLVLSLTVSCCWLSCCEVLSLTGALTYCVMLLTFLLWSVEFDWCSYLLCHAADVLAVKCWVWLVLLLTVSCCWRSCCEVLSLTGALTYCVMLLTFLLWSVEFDWCSHLLCHAADVLAVKCWVWLVLSLTVSCCWRSCCEVLSLTGALTYCVMLLTFLLWSVEFDWCSHLLCHAVDVLAVKCWVWLVLLLTVSCCWRSCCEVLSLTGALTYCVMLLTFLLWSVEFDWCSHLLCHAVDVLAVKCWVWLVLSLTVSCCWRSCCEVLSLTGALTYCVMLLTFLLWSVESDWCSHLLCHAVDVLAVKCWVWLVLSLTVSCCWRSCCEVLSLTGALTYCVMLLTFLLWSVEFDWCSHLLCHAADVLAVKCWVWLVLSLTVSCCWRSCCEVLSLTGALTYCVMLLTFLLWSVEFDWCSHLLCHAVDVLAVKCWVWLVLSLTVSCCWRSCCEVLSLTGALTYCVMLLTFLLWSVEFDWCSHLLCHAVDVLAVKCWVWLVLSLTVSCCWRSCCEVLSLTGALTYCVMLLTFLLWSVEFDWCSHLLCHAVDVLAVKCWVWLVLSLTVSCCWRSCCEVLSLTGALTYCVMLLTFLLWSVENVNSMTQ